uniref:NB-ARC domain-containing protein n=1 Tax=Aegilops tauschii subsp. strangulata TaxID=200361 RepID=A0A453Q7K1_AEGTS
AWSNLLTVVEDEVGMLLGVTGQIDKMGVKLGDLKKFLADAERRRITDTSVQGWVTELKRAMYDATDILDICQLKAMDHHAASRMGCCNPLLFCLRNPLFAHEIGTRIRALNQKLDAIKERSAAFGFDLASYEDSCSKVHSSRLSTSRETSWELDRSGVVGEKIEEDTRALVEIMVRRTEAETSNADNNRVMVFAIVGVGGIGKTTLAREVFNDEAINANFDKRIWLSVNQDFDKVELLRTAITLAGGKHRSEKALAVLRPILSDALTGKKIFLVMDDVWSHEAWGDVLETPLNAVARGSRVLVTTRDTRVARGVKAVLPYHHIDKLDDEDAWSLLRKQVISSETDGPEVDMLKDIGLQIAVKCGGLPLAVKVMGGLLCQKDKQRHEWNMVLNDSIWSASEMPEELNYSIYFSYEDLPPSIKQCFLYYSLLPKSAAWSKNGSIGMWISEGFLHGTSADLEELGSKYYKELILRNLIEPVTIWSDQQVCSMHDVVRSFAQFVARDEALAAHSGDTGFISKLSAHKFLRLSMEKNVSESDGLDWSSLHAQKTLRTLILVGPISMKPSDSIVDFPCLRTLHAESIDVAVLVESLGKLKHLRYLLIQKSNISSLPDNIGNMKFLQFIGLVECQQFVKVPHSILKLGQLRYLNFYDSSVNSIPRGFCVLTNLRNLRGFPAQTDGVWCSLDELGPLSELRSLGVQRLENVSVTSSAAKAKLGEKVHLTHLFLYCSSILGDDGLIKDEKGVSEEEQRQIAGVFDELCPSPSLEYLDINGFFGRRLPRWMTSRSAAVFKSLRIILMYDLACCTQLPDGLCQLPCLQEIDTRRAPAIKRVGPEFLQPHLATAAFPRLQKMCLVDMVEWEEWEWEEQVQAMPLLEVLELENCRLRCLPPGLASHARALKSISAQNNQHLNSLENFASVVELEVAKSPDLERITNLPNLRKLEIETCPKLKVLEGICALQRLVLEDYAMETLPEYMRDVNPRHFELRCSLTLLTSIAAGQSGPEWDRFSHIDHVKAYAPDENNTRKWYVLYTREPCSLITNVSHSTSAGKSAQPCHLNVLFHSVHLTRLVDSGYVEEDQEVVS